MAAGLTMSVLVQRMVDAKAAGVAFSIDPLHGTRDTVVVHAVKGLGDALVSGEVDPDRFRVSSDGRVVAEPPAEDELRRHQAFLAGVLVTENATPAGILETLRYFDLYEIELEYRANFVERVHDALPADIQRVARTYFQPRHMVIVVVGDRRTLTAQLASIGKVTD